MRSQKMMVYMDESGTLNQSVARDDRYYVVAAVNCTFENLAMVEAAVRDLKARECKDGELKSSNVGANETRRKRILSELNKLPITVDLLIVDKAYAIETYPGAKYKGTFFRFLRRLLLSHIVRSGCSIQVVMDEFGRSDFMEGTISYISRHFNGDLLTQAEFTRSQDNPLVQIADIFAGSCRRYWESQENNAIHMAQNVIARFIPISDYHKIEVTKTDSDPVASTIAMISVELIFSFLKQNEHTEDIDKQILCFICNQLYAKHLEKPNAYVTAGTLRRKIEQQFNEGMSATKFKSKVIAPLRDQGVIIATSSHGYKIPSCKVDIESYCRQVNNMVLPYLERLSHARDIFHSGTGGNYDFLSDTNFTVLSELIRTLKKLQPAKSGAWSGE